jgi:hypothetical protein
MIYYKIESMAPLNGLNIYPLDDKNSAGFVIKLGPAEFRVRYSKRVKRWFINCAWNRRNIVDTEYREIKWQ